MSRLLELNIGYFYKDELNLYGDNGNVEVLVKRAADRDIRVNVIVAGLDTCVDKALMDKLNLVFMGGGPDSKQKLIYDDLVKNKGPFLKDYIENCGVGLFICGSYQLLGNYYKASDGAVLPGLKVFNLYTEHYGKKAPRCIGNTLAILSDRITSDPSFYQNNSIGDNTIVGFENHGGRTFLGKGSEPFAFVQKGTGNNPKDRTEGIYYKSSIGTYFHGPILARNPHVADFLISKALNIFELKKLDDTLIVLAHTASKRLKR